MPQILLLKGKFALLTYTSEQILSGELLAKLLQGLELQDKSTISYHTLSGGYSPIILYFKGHVYGSPVVVFVDCCSTHNFIQTRAAKFLYLTIEPTTNFSVVVGNVQRLRFEGIIKKVLFTVQETNFLMDLYLLVLHGTNSVLGGAWLATLGDVLTHLSTYQMEFTLE